MTWSSYNPLIGLMNSLLFSMSLLKTAILDGSIRCLFSCQIRLDHFTSNWYYSCTQGSLRDNTPESAGMPEKVLRLIITVNNCTPKNDGTPTNTMQLSHI